MLLLLLQLMMMIIKAEQTENNLSALQKVIHTQYMQMIALHCINGLQCEPYPLRCPILMTNRTIEKRFDSDRHDHQADDHSV